MNKKLDKIESRLRTLFEKHLLSIFSHDSQQPTLVDDLLGVMKDNLREDKDGGFLAPDQFIFKVPPDDFSNWLAHKDLLEEMASVIHKTGSEEGFIFRHPPEIRIQNNPELSQNDFSISASFTAPKPNLRDTAAMAQNEQNRTSQSLPDNAFFVIGGEKNFPLEKNVINIGRHSDNDLILDDLHVSRHHAQLRSINQRFVIFDVGSSGGLFLNGKKISQATLQPGDVIRLGVTNLIYVQDSTGEHPTTAMSADSEDHVVKGSE
jgi:pSer/pThr/pTyr-binding forkhead associated (FHA) protein